MRGVVFAGLAAVLAAAPAMAQLANGAVLGAGQLKSSLFGIEMEGYSPTFNMRWRECIAPDGETLYETPAGVMKGRLTISAQGLACFAYEDDGYASPACYVTKKVAGGFRFEHSDSSVFITTKVVTGVRSCEKQDLIG